MSKRQLSCSCRQRGFTLIETIVTIALAALLLMVAAPAMTAYKRSSEMTSATNRLLAAVNATRGEAMKRGVTTLLVPSLGGSDWSTGWTVFVDIDGTQALPAGGRGVIASTGALPSYVKVSGNGAASGGAPYLMFNASGYSKTKSGAFGALSFTLSRSDSPDSGASGMTRKIVISSTGRARVCKPASASDPDCSDANVW
ncbi:MAG: prepilin-type N-terminal cleavage/methylation domain-containing protein [Comamonadaceae bacterium]|nr:MAG: prepilin-type N-terminal cleavage/methylation domain-containing protein [Comamonadaceae bacterium]